MDNPVFDLTPKQAEYIVRAHRRWNLLIGATQCGKTTIHRNFVIPSRIFEVADKPGLNLLTGATIGTCERNVLGPMREQWGSSLIGEIHVDAKGTYATLFNQKVYVIGCKDKKCVPIIRGMTIKNHFGDEICDCCPELLEILPSRLSLPYSQSHMTGNPQYPTHPVKAFLDKIDAGKIDGFHDTWTIFDNTYLDPAIVRETCAEYAGTIFFDRYILGKWKRAEGSIYPFYSDHPDRFWVRERPKDIQSVVIGVDFGGNKSAHAFVATGFSYGMRRVVALRAKKIEHPDDVEQLTVEFLKFVDLVYNDYRLAMPVYCDSAEQTLINTLRKEAGRHGSPVAIMDAWKTEINDRIRLETSLMQTGRFQIVRDQCEDLDKSLQEAVWDPKSQKDVRLDDNTYCVDMLDAFEYTIERFAKTLAGIDAGREER